MDKPLLFYLASPFTHASKNIRAQRTYEAMIASIKLLQHNIHVFSPIAYNGAWEKTKFNLPCEWPFWENYDKNFLRRCDGFIILQIDGWDTSVGIAAETRYAKEIGLPIFKVTPEDIENGNLKQIQRFIDKKHKKRKKPKKPKKA